MNRLLASLGMTLVAVAGALSATAAQEASPVASPEALSSIPPIVWQSVDYTPTAGEGIAGAFENAASGERIETTDGGGSFRVTYGAGGGPESDPIVLDAFVAPELDGAAAGFVAIGLLAARARAKARSDQARRTSSARKSPSVRIPCNASPATTGRQPIL